MTLPQDQRLLADLTAPRWELSGSTIKVESRDDILKRIGRSPDFASALILAAAQPEDEFVVGVEDPTVRWDRPLVHKRRDEYDPLRILDLELGLTQQGGADSCQLPRNIDPAHPGRDPAMRHDFSW